MTQAAILLAAGHSRRFGAANKLCALINGTPILSHSASNLAASGADVLIAVLGDPALADLLPEGYQVVTCSGQQSDSLRAGLAAARAIGASGCLIALGDMPFVTGTFFRQILDAADSTTPSATSGGAGAMPPACFPAAYFDRLDAIQGDRGARQLLISTPRCHLVPAPPAMLRDIDTVADLRACR
ncbi:nucleotidyltransferase family protein [Paracoccus seriniphilus]|uniref:Molybdenum cofactor cytidylyltransferase n=1 Tax=Paracoccus seriniphilus TaxID=184748 RepID=A0A239Q1T6_9RHOB|nr:nucleotidyltransferase family protein [Paracoccus seriniphilus]WCR15862.1 nucleotidyltransferase family protein [Paracoccus seriniphilus]SNT76511.1 molybdenum cofactor cytidylyltransferase [Paracoccus seriniphilus]